MRQSDQQWRSDASARISWGGKRASEPSISGRADQDSVPRSVDSATPEFGRNRRGSPVIERLWEVRLATSSAGRRPSPKSWVGGTDNAAAPLKRPNYYDPGFCIAPGRGEAWDGRLGLNRPVLTHSPMPCSISPPAVPTNPGRSEPGNRPHCRSGCPVERQRYRSVLRAAASSG